MDPTSPRPRGRPGPYSLAIDLRKIRALLHGFSIKVRSLPASPAQIHSWTSILKSLGDSLPRATGDPRNFFRSFSTTWQQLSTDLASFLADDSSDAVIAFCREQYAKAIEHLRSPVPPLTPAEWQFFFPPSTNISQFSDLAGVPGRETAPGRRFLQIVRGAFRLVSRNPAGLCDDQTELHYSRNTLARVAESLQTHLRSAAAKRAFRADFDVATRAMSALLQPPAPPPPPARVVVAKSTKSARPRPLPRYGDPPPTRREPPGGSRFESRLYVERRALTPPHTPGDRRRPLSMRWGRPARPVRPHQPAISIGERVPVGNGGRKSSSSEYNFASDPEMSARPGEKQLPVAPERQMDPESLASREWSKDDIGYHTDSRQTGGYYAYSEEEDA
jgi:hypothetical protein